MKSSIKLTDVERNSARRHSCTRICITFFRLINPLALIDTVRYAKHGSIHTIVTAVLLLSCSYTIAGSITIIPGASPYIEIGRLQDISYTFTENDSNSWQSASGTSNVTPCTVTTDRFKLILSTAVEGTISSPVGEAFGSSACALDFEAYFQNAPTPFLRYKYGGFGAVNIDPTNEIGTYGWSFGGFIETPEGVRFDLPTAKGDFSCDGSNPENALTPNCIENWGGGWREYDNVEDVYFGPVRGSIWLRAYFDLSTTKVSTVPEPNVLILLGVSLASFGLARKLKQYKSVARKG